MPITANGKIREDYRTRCLKDCGGIKYAALLQALKTLVQVQNTSSCLF